MTFPTALSLLLEKATFSEIGPLEYVPAPNDQFITTIHGRYANGEPCGVAYTCCGNADRQNDDASLIVLLANAAPAIKELAEAAEKMLGMYVAMINSGDCGSWNPEDDAEVKALRAALARLEEGA